MVLVAAALIVQMVVWMRRHGRTLKKDITSGLSTASQNEHWWGVFTLALIAVAHPDHRDRLAFDARTLVEL